MVERLRRRYATFLTPDPQRVDSRIDVRVRPGARYIEAEPGPWVIESSYSQERLTFRSFTEQGEVDLRRGEGWLELHPSAHVENFLRVLFAWLCLQNNAILLHSAGVIRQGRGYVFFGPSGAGKTTTSYLAAQTADVVSDDLTIIRLEQGRCWLYGVPFKGELSDAPRANQHAPLFGLYRLRQDTTHYLEPLSSVRGVAELVAAAPFVVSELNLSQQLMALCQQIVATVPVQELHFSRDDGFWKVIDGLDQRLPAAASPNGRAGY
jgi:hypothetical protein